MANVRQSGDVQIVEPSGDVTIGKSDFARPLDLHGRRMEDVGETLDRLMSVARTRIVIDLRRVRFIDSAGIGHLVRWKKRAVQQGGDIKLVVADGVVRQILEMTRLERVFGIFEDESQAVDSFGGGPAEQ